MREQSTTVSSPRRRQPHAPVRVPLDNKGSYDKTDFRGVLEASRDHKIDRNINEYDIMSVQRKYTIIKSAKHCGYRLLPNETGATYGIEKHSARKRLLGVQSCKTKNCKRCGRIKGMTMANTLATVATDALQNNRAVGALTLTIPHHRLSPTAQVTLIKKCETKFYRKVKKYLLDRGSSLEDYGTSYDETISGAGKVHIHKHAQWILGNDIILDSQTRNDVFEIWRDIVDKETDGRRIPNEKGFFLEPVYDASLDGKYSNYVYKFGAEKASMETMSSLTKTSNKGYSLPQLLDYIYRTGCDKAVKIYRSILRAYQGTQYRTLSRGMKEKAEEIEMVKDMTSNLEIEEEEIPEEWLEIRFIKQGHYAIGHLNLQSAVFRVLMLAQKGDIKAQTALLKLRTINEYASGQIDYTFERAICDFALPLWEYRSVNKPNI
jgi:hypothetical protein